MSGSFRDILPFQYLACVCSFDLFFPIKLSFQNTECFKGLTIFLPTQLLKQCCLSALLNLACWTTWAEKKQPKSQTPVQFCSDLQQHVNRKSTGASAYFNHGWVGLIKKQDSKQLFQIRKKSSLSNSTENNAGPFASTMSFNKLFQILLSDLVTPFVIRIS